MAKTKNLWKQEKKLNQVGEAGVWVDYDDGISMLVGSSETPRYKSVFVSMHEQLRAKYKTRDVPDDIAEKAFNEVYADAILLDWKGMVDENDAAMPYSRDNVLKVLSELTRVRAFVVAFANDRKNFSVGLEDDGTKNSSAASSGVSSGAVQ